MEVSPQRSNHQTVRLSAGKHCDPDHGVCVMELSSMLAGERFSDAPRSVCPVVAAFMRRYNDAVDDERRQDLYGFAARAVGTAAGREAEWRRGELCRRLVTSPSPAAGPKRARFARTCAARHAADRAAALLAGDPRHHIAALTFLSSLIGSDEMDAMLIGLTMEARAPDVPAVP